MSKAKEIDSKSFETEVLKSEIPVLVDFWASWCQPCMMMASILDELTEDKDLAGKIVIAKFNVESPKNQEIATQYDILSIPNMKVFKDGKIIKEIIGLRSKEVMKEELEKIIKSNPKSQ